ncbi:hypothetical protein C8R45DRAFT_330652 [Mycena sanguinolenta]|nr:hypothetical protein C8R45DRAFT_330652 [Mycena sanguinolenta]
MSGNASTTLEPNPSTMAALVSTGLTEEETYILGGWDLAICCVLFLQGVLCSQFAHYTDFMKRDSMRIKLFVAGLAFLTTLKTLECLAIMWTQNVTLFADVEAASTMWTTAWFSKITVLLETIVAFYVQMFFCYRLWEISGNIFIAISCIIVFSFALICGVLETFYVFTVQKVGLTLTSPWFETHMGVALFGDLVLTGSIIFWLLRHNKAANSRGSTATTIVSSLVRLAVQSAAPVALCTLINFIVIMLRAHTPSGTPALLMVDFITNNILPQLYAWSAMWTLNSREETVAAGNTPYTVNLGSSSSNVKTGQIPHATESAITSESSAIMHQDHLNSQAFSEV